MAEEAKYEIDPRMLADYLKGIWEEMSMDGSSGGNTVAKKNLSVSSIDTHRFDVIPLTPLPLMHSM